MEKLKIYYNVLTTELIQQIRAYSHTKQEHRVNLTSWSPGIVGFSGPIILFDLTDPLLTAVKTQVLPVLELDNPDHYVLNAIYTLGSRFSFIPWHTDNPYVRACTVYLNDTWSRDWAGMFLYEHDGPDDCRAIYPEFNKAVVLYPPVPHTTTMPAIDAPLRESLQVFVSLKPDDAVGEKVRAVNP